MLPPHLRYTLTLVCFLAIAFVCLPGLATASECHRDGPAVVTLTDTTSRIQIARNVSVLPNTGVSLDLAAVRRIDDAGLFQRHCGSRLKAPVEDGALWLRLDVRRDADTLGRWALAFGEAEIDDIRLFRPVDGRYRLVAQTGRAVSPDERGIGSRLLAVTASLPPDDVTRLYVRVSGVSVPYVSAALVPAHVQTSAEALDLMMLTAVLGFLSAMMVYNAVLYWRTRNAAVLWYTAYLAAAIVWIGCYDGVFYRLAGSAVAGHTADIVGADFMLVAVALLTLFGRAILDLPHTAPRANAVALSLVGLLTLVGATETYSPSPGYIASSLATLFAVAFMAVCAIMQARHGHLSARYFSWSFSALLAGGIVTSGAFYVPAGISPTLVEFAQKWGAHIGVCIETILVSLAITSLFRGTRIQPSTSPANGANHAHAESLGHAVPTAADPTGADIGDALPVPLSDDQRMVRRATEIIQRNLATEGFDVRTLAETLAVSEQTLRRRLDHAVGLSPAVFIRRQRLDAAQRLIEARAHRTVAEVAHEVGFATPGYFSRLYRETFGQSPRELLRGD